MFKLSANCFIVAAFVEILPSILPAVGWSTHSRGLLILTRLVRRQDGIVGGCYGLTICPDHVSCFVPGTRWVMTTSTACFFSFLGGIEHTLYETSSPSIGTYSPSISEMWTKISAPPFAGTMNPWPFEREKHLQTPL